MLKYQRSSLAKRLPVPLVPSLDSRLGTYAIAAAAAGCLASAQPATAEVVYTPANVQLANGTTFLDLNADGLNDFNIVNQYLFYGSVSVDFRRQKLAVGGNTGASVILSGGHGSAGALAPGAVIGSGDNFKPVHNVNKQMLFGLYAVSASGITLSTVRGNWDGVANRFLGLKFLISGQVHYGWARLSTKSTGHGRFSAVLTGYAYESTPNQSIKAGQISGTSAQQSGSLGQLARGQAK